MYYIYYIKNIKVGCTKNLKQRVENQQGYNNYIILDKTNCINKATELEILWQNIFNFKNDSIPYKKLINLNKKKMEQQQNSYYDSGHTTTFINSNNENLNGYMFPKQLKLKDGNVIELNELIIDYIKKTNHKSQFSDERFIYNKNLINYYLRYEDEDKTIYDNIRIWAKQKGIYDSGDCKTQYIKLMEEAGELAQAILKNDESEFIDAIGDMVVVLTNLAKLKNYKIEDCIVSAYNVIKTREGKMINGTFVKNK